MGRGWRRPADGPPKREPTQKRVRYLSERKPRPEAYFDEKRRKKRFLVWLCSEGRSKLLREGSGSVARKEQAQVFF